MPNWKKVIVSGSDAALNSLNVTAHFTASGLIYPTASGTNGQVIVTDGAGKLSFSNSAISASYALTASFSQATTENKILVMNKSGATMAKGVVVHITGSNNSSDTPYVILASYENDNNSANTLGITSQTIANNDTGFVTTEGVLTGIDVTGFTSGQLIYLGISGSITGSAPLPPLHSVRLGQVVRDSPSNNGAIYVRVDNGYEIGELHDVRDTTTTSSFGDLLVKSGSIWITSKQLTGSYGLTGSLSATSFTGSLLGTASFASTASFINVTGSNAFVQGGNSFGAQALLGTNDNQSLAFETSGSTRMFISSSGAIGVNTSTPPYRFTVLAPNAGDGIASYVGSTAMVMTGNNGSGNPGISSTSGIIHISSTINGTGGSEVLNVNRSANGTYIQSWRSFTSNILSLVDSTGRFSIGFSTLPSASLHISGASADNLLRIDSPSGNNILFVTGSGRIGVNTNTPNFTLDAPSGSLRFFTVSVGNDGAGSAQMSTSGNYMFVAGNNNHDVILPGLFAARSGTGYGVGIQATQYPAVAASAMLTLTSTTKGFLPTRTNLTSNISSPAQGLMTYITSSIGEGLYYYNSGSYQGWTRILNDSGSQSITGSLVVTQNVTASRVYISSSNGTANGSTLTVYGSGSSQPVFTVQGSQGELFSVTDSLSGSLYSVNDISGLPILEVFSDSTILMGNYQDPMLITTTKLVTTASGAFTLYALPTASYDTAFFEYSIKSGSNARAGSIMAIQSGTSVNFTETTTTDFGSTSGFGFTVQVSGANMLLTGSATTSGWTIKTIVRSI